MSHRQNAVLFYVNLLLISLVNLILIYAVFSYFVLRQPSPQIEWLLGVFATEVLGCFVLGWRKLVGPEGKTLEPQGKADEETIRIVGRGTEALAIEKSEISEDEHDPDVILKDKGVALLVMARDKSLTLETRKKHAQKAIKIFAQIPKSSAAYFPAKYNTGTAFRILGEFQKAVAIYEKVKEIVSEGGAHYTKEERRIWAAELEMMIGNVYFEQNILDKAKSFYLKSWKIDPDKLFAMLNLFEVAFKLSNLGEAQMWAELMSTHEEYSSISSLVDTKMRLLQDSHLKEPAHAPPSWPQL